MGTEKEEKATELRKLRWDIKKILYRVRGDVV